MFFFLNLSLELHVAAQQFVWTVCNHQLFHQYLAIPTITAFRPHEYVLCARLLFGCSAPIKRNALKLYSRQGKRHIVSPYENDDFGESASLIFVVYMPSEQVKSN